MKTFWITLALGVLGITATYFITQSTFSKKFEKWKTEFVSNYRATPETVTVVRDSVIRITKWIPARPLNLSFEDSTAIAETIFGLSFQQKDSLLLVLSSDRDAEPVTDTMEIGDSIKVTSTHYLSFSPLQENPFGRFSYLNEVIYPRGGSTVIIDSSLCETSLFSTPYLSAFGNYSLNQKSYSGGGSFNLPVNIGGLKFTPSVGYSSVIRGNVGVSISKELW